MPSAPTFYVVPGSPVKCAIDDNKVLVFDAVEAAYCLHGSENTLNPNSRYPDRPSARMRCSASSPARGATHTVAAAYVVGSRYLKRRAENA